MNSAVDPLNLALGRHAPQVPGTKPWEFRIFASRAVCSVCPFENALLSRLPKDMAANRRSHVIYRSLGNCALVDPYR